MGLLNTILGRTKPVQSNLDALFALPSAAITLQSAAGMTTSGHAGVCFKPPSGQGFEDMQAEVVKLLSMDGTEGLRNTNDAYGYHWLVLEDPDIEQLVTQIHLVNSSLSDAGWGPQLLCSVFGLARLPSPTPPLIRARRSWNRRPQGLTQGCRMQGCRMQGPASWPSGQQDQATSSPRPPTWSICSSEGRSIRSFPTDTSTATSNRN